MHEMFYVKNSEIGNNKNKTNNYIKIIPKNIKEYLTPFALAIWFMDDGSRINNTVRIATNNFTYVEIQFLCDVLYEKFNIKATVNKNGKDKGYIIYIKRESYLIFYNLIKPYILPSMLYKLKK